MNITTYLIAAVAALVGLVIGLLISNLRSAAARREQQEKAEKIVLAARDHRTAGPRPGAEGYPGR